MIRRLIAALLAVGLLALASGCSSVFEDEYLYVTDHVNPTPTGAVSEVQVVESAGDIARAVLDLVTHREETGTLQLYTEEDAAELVSKVIQQLLTEEPMVAYAVEYITPNVTQIVSYYNVDLSIAYTKTRAEIMSVENVSSVYAAREVIQEAMQTGDDYLALQLYSNIVDAAYVQNFIVSSYYENPMYVIAMPEVTVNLYPDDGVEKIVEISFSYAYSRSEMNQMRQALAEHAQALVEGIYGEEAESAYRACVALLEYAQCQTGAQGSGPDNTAYGTLVGGLGDSEGFAMAYKILCDLLGLECAVVAGRLDGEPHYWNIVRIDGDYYHIDPYICGVEGMSVMFLERDADILGRYWWDTSAYNACTGTLTYYDVISALGYVDQNTQDPVEESPSPSPSEEEPEPTPSASLEPEI